LLSKGHDYLRFVVFDAIVEFRSCDGGGFLGVRSDDGVGLAGGFVENYLRDSFDAQGALLLTHLRELFLPFDEMFVESDFGVGFRIHREDSDTVFIKRRDFRIDGLTVESTHIWIAGEF